MDDIFCIGIEKSGDSSYFGGVFFLSPAEALRTIESIVKQIEGQLRSLHLVGPDARTHLFSMDEANRHAGDDELVQCALAGGLYPNIAVPIVGSQKRLETAAGVKAVAQNLRPSDRWVVYEKAARGQGRSISLQNATPVSALSVLCFAGQSLVAGADAVDGEDGEDQEDGQGGSWDGEDAMDGDDDAAALKSTLTLDDWARARLDEVRFHPYIFGGVCGCVCVCV